MPKEMEIEVFRAGDYGPRGSYDADALDRIAADYSAQLHEAPVTTDHRQEGPALGWVRGLRRAGEVLVARLGGLTDELLSALRNGAFKKRSIEIYRAFETTGRPYLRAVTFLGAAAPVVKGLSDPVFSETDGAVCVEFRETDEDSAPSVPDPEETPSPLSSSDWENDAAARVEEPDNENADDSAQTIKSAESSPSTSSIPSTSSTFSAPAPTAVERFCDDFCREMRAQGRLLPAWEDRGLARFMALLDDATPIHFAKSEDAPSTTPRAWFREFLETLPALVPMGEAAPSSAGGDLRFRELGAPPALPENWRGVRIDDRSVALHQRVVRFCQSHPEVAYAEALSALDGR